MAGSEHERIPHRALHLLHAQAELRAYEISEGCGAFRLLAFAGPEGEQVSDQAQEMADRAIESAQAPENNEDFIKALQERLNDRVLSIIAGMLAIRGPKGARESELVRLVAWALEPSYRAIMAQAISDRTFFAEMPEEGEDPLLYLPEWCIGKQNEAIQKFNEKLESDRLEQQRQIDELKALVASQSASVNKFIGKITKIVHTESVSIASKETVIESKPQAPDLQTDVPPLPKLPLRFPEKSQALRLQARFSERHVKTECVYESGFWIVKERTEAVTN